MKKMAALFLALAMMFSCTACSLPKQEEPVNMKPEAAQMKAICELAVMECYYHNVAKYYKEDVAREFLVFGSKDKHFWIEYSGVVQFGIDVSLVSIEVEDTQVTITLPEAKVLGCKVDSSSITEDSFIVDKKSAAVEAADEVEAFGEAQRQLEETAAQDKALLASAQQRAQSLLEEYITNIGDVTGKRYSIQWIYADAEGNPLGGGSGEAAAAGQAPAG